jgi:deazaflavin-dependent oxidoreductase (nitroreductase family)
MNGNDFMSWVLRSPLHGLLSNGMMLITVTGRKTGKKYATPVGYYRENGTLWVITSRNRTWWRNLCSGAEISLLLKRKPVHGFAELELDETAVESRLVEYLRHIPQAVNSWKIRMENGMPNAEDIARIARDRLFVKVKLLE